MRAALLLALLASPAAAACPGGDRVFWCQIGPKALELCHTDGALIYSFGPKGRPELTIAEPLETVDFTPWPGIGRYIWETVAFRNAGFTYQIHTSVERGPDATTGLVADLTVFDGDAEIALLACDMDTATNSLDRIYDLKAEIGQCWDMESRSWGLCN